MNEDLDLDAIQEWCDRYQWLSDDRGWMSGRAEALCVALREAREENARLREQLVGSPELAGLQRCEYRIGEQPKIVERVEFPLCRCGHDGRDHADEPLRAPCTKCSCRAYSNPFSKRNGHYGKDKERIRRALIRRDGLVCRWCGCHLTAETMTIDHLRPRVAGGTNALRNLVLACPDCNIARSATKLGRARRPSDGVVVLEWAS